MIDVVTIPVAKESPFFTSLKLALKILRESGHLEKLRSKYALDFHDHNECDPPVVKQLYSHCFFIVSNLQ